MMSLRDRREVSLEIRGLGIILYSPYAVAAISEGEDYLSEYTWEHQVQKHIQRGDLVGFDTGSPGRFLLRLFDGYPADDRVREAKYKLRLGLVVKGEEVHFRALYDLMSWS